MRSQPDRADAASDADLTSAMARIGMLERRVRQISAVAIGLAAASVGAAAAALHGTQSIRAMVRDGTIEAHRFVLADRAGKPRAVLGLEPSGAANFYLTDTHGTARATLGVGADGVPALGLGDEHGALRAAMAIGTDGASSVGFFDPHRNLRARLGVRADVVPALDIFDEAQRDRVLLAAEPGRSLLRIADRSGQTRIGLGLSAGVPAIVVFDDKGAAIGQFP